jgi:hypothetical protein
MVIIIQVTREAKIGGWWFNASLDKDVKPYLKNN